MGLPAVSPESTAASVAGAALLTSLGLDPAALFWAFVGACIGMTFAAAATRTRTAIVFCCVVLACSLFGAWLTAQYTSGAPLTRDVFACVLAIVFHPLVNAMIAFIPKILTSVLGRFGIGGP